MGAFGGFMGGMSKSGGTDKLASKLKKKKSSSSGSSDAGGGGAYDEMGNLPSYHKGGMVKKTGPANLKKGEKVLTKKQQKKMRGKC